MNHILELTEENISYLESIFETINKGNTILILGAGASVGDKKYLSQEIIDYYEAKKGITFNISDIKEFVDVLESTNGHSRAEFDRFVYDLLNNLRVSDAHKAMVSIPWRWIITTNYDLLIEKAYDEVKNTSNYSRDIVPVRSIQEFNRLSDINELKYIKLHGCMSDRSKYPFVFSSSDYNKIQKFYKVVLSSLKSPSDKIKIISIGYSYNDKFAYSFLNTLDKDSYRDRRELINVDPYVNDKMLEYYSANNISVIKLTTEEFFNQYVLWEERTYKNKQQAKGISIIDIKSNPIKISYKLSNNLDFSLKQLNSKSISKITERDFLLGEEPDFSVVLNNYDVVNQNLIAGFKNFIYEKILENNKTALIPIFCLTGSFGTGKTTYTYRLIRTIIEDSDLETLAFEITDFDNIRIQDYVDLILTANTKNILFYTNNIEVDSVFKSLLSLRAELSIKQISTSNIFFIVSVRENILSRYKTKSDYKNLFEYSMPKTFSENEIVEFVSKLKKNELLDYRDLQERNRLIYKIKTEFKGDQFISLVKFVSSGKHIDNLRDAYFQLSKDCRKAFVYTALLHRFEIKMPSNLLRSLVSKDWEDFKTNVIEVEGKGILIQESVNTKDLDPDLYFRTKHPIIAELLIQEVLRTKDKIFANYLEIFRSITPAFKNSRLVSNLLKAITRKGEISNEKINRLYDVAYSKLEDDPFYILNYAINLQNRASKSQLYKALDLLVYAEGLLEYKNDKFIHRRGVINFELAKLFYKEESELNLTLKYLTEAESLLDVKLYLDPCSSFSYTDYLKLLIWQLENISMEKEQFLSIRIQIDDLYEVAISSITEGMSFVNEIYYAYKEKYHSTIDSEDYLKELDELYESVNTRPYACILKFKFFDEFDDYYEEKDSLLQEMSTYIYNNDVAKFLFRYYSLRLNFSTYRIKFFHLINNVNTLKDFKNLMYDYYMYVAESYNGNYSYALNFIKDIDRTYNYLNPDYQLVWKESDSDEKRIFSGTIVKHTKGYFMFKSYELQNRFLIRKNGVKIHSEGAKVKAYLHFYFNGIRAEILTNIDDIESN